MTKEQAQSLYRLGKDKTPKADLLNDPKNWAEENRPLTPAELQYAAKALVQ